MHSRSFDPEAPTVVIRTTVPRFSPRFSPGFSPRCTPLEPTMRLARRPPTRISPEAGVGLFCLMMLLFALGFTLGAQRTPAVEQPPIPIAVERPAPIVIAPVDLSEP